MKTAIRSLSALLFFALLGPTITSTWAQINITTQRYDNARTGANLNETVLNTSNVNSTQFGKLYSYVVDGSVQASPLYVSNLAIPGGGSRNVLFVVTMNDVVYALDADSNATNGGILWKADYRNPGAGVGPIPIVDIVHDNTLNIVGNVGIESTPIIDLSSKTMYLVARTKEVSGGTTNYVARLHALDITTGAEKFGGPVIIQGSVPGTGFGSSGTVLTFDPLIHNQRSSLVLANGLVVFAWGSHEDYGNWHGWVFAYNAQTLQQSSILSVNPNSWGGGIWMSGRAPAVDTAGNLYYATGNGDWDGSSSFGDSVLKIATTGGTLSLVDYFTPDDYATLQANDLDLGSSGPLLIPGTNLMIQGSKTATFYVMSTGNLGHEKAGNNQIVQNFSTTGTVVHSGPVFWNRTTDAGPTMYVWLENTTLQAFQFNGSSFNTSPISQSTIVAPSGHSAGVLTLSANGSTSGSGIVWSSMPINENADHGEHAGLLRAFDDNNLSTELWDSEMNSARDSLGNWPKFSSPTVVNGRVYVAAFPSDGVSAGTVSVYGLLSSPDFSISTSPSSKSVLAGNATTYTTNIGALNGFAGVVTLSVSGLPAGATAGFSPGTVTGTGSSTLTVTTTGSTPVGTSTLTIRGTSGSLTHTTTVSLVVNAQAPPPDFTISGSPSTQTVVQGKAATYTTTIGALNGFGGVVTLGASGLPTGATAGFSPATVTGTGSSTLTVTTAGSTPAGTSTLTITGTSGSVTHTATVTLTVTAAGRGVISIDFVGQGTAMGSTEVAGVVAKANWNNASGQSNATPQGLVDESGTATGATAVWNTNGIWNLSITDTAGNARMMRGYLDTVGGTTTVTVAGLPTNSAGYDVYVYADGDNPATRTGAYQISGTGITTTSVNLTDPANTNFSGTFTQANNSNGNYVKFTITATGFTITATPGVATDGFPRAPVNGIQIVPH